MNDPRKIIDLEADSPIERAFVALLFKCHISFDAQQHLLDNLVTYSVKDEEDLEMAKLLLYRVLHPREKVAP